jgi:hypothetical protein
MVPQSRPKPSPPLSSAAIMVFLLSSSTTALFSNISRRLASRLPPTATEQIAEYRTTWLGTNQAVTPDGAGRNGKVLYMRWIGNARFAHCCPLVQKGVELLCPDGPQITFSTATLKGTPSSLAKLAAKYDVVLLVSEVRLVTTRMRSLIGQPTSVLKALPRNALNVMYSMEPPRYSMTQEPTHRPDFTAQFDLGLTFESGGDAFGQVQQTYVTRSNLRPCRIAGHARHVVTGTSRCTRSSLRSRRCAWRSRSA